MKMFNLNLLALCMLSACHGQQTPETPREARTFQRPQALLFVDDLLLVTETGYGRSGWQTGHLALIDPTTATFLERWPTSQLNPQRIRSDGHSVFVVNSGSFDFADFESPQAATAGGVDMISIETIKTRRPEIENWVLPVPEDHDAPSAPIDIAINNDQMVVTSALRPAVWLSQRQLPSETTTLVHLNSQANIGLGSVAVWRDRFLIIDFNSDAVTFITPQGTLADCSVHIGSDEIAFEGAQSPLVHEDNLYILMALSGRVISLDLNQLIEHCTVHSRVVIPSTGQVPNDMHFHENEIFLVHSGDNNITSVCRSVIVSSKISLNLRSEL